MNYTQRRDRNFATFISIAAILVFQIGAYIPLPLLTASSEADKGIIVVMAALVFTAFLLAQAVVIISAKLSGLYGARFYILETLSWIMLLLPVLLYLAIL